MKQRFVNIIEFLDSTTFNCVLNILFILRNTFRYCVAKWTSKGRYE